MAEHESISDHEHDIHHVEPSWWPPILALSLGLVGIGIIIIGGGLTLPGLTIPLLDITIIPVITLYDTTIVNIAGVKFGVGLLFIFLFFVIFALGLLAETSPKGYDQSHEKKAHRHEIVPTTGFAKHTWMWFFLASEVLFFTIVIGSSLSLRFRVGSWSPAEVLDVFLTALNTFVLITSSYTMAKGLQAIERGDQRRSAMFIFATVGIGALFLIIQAFEYYELIHIFNFNPANSTGFITLHGHTVQDPNLQIFASTFFLQTGFHGLHVFFGVFIMFFVALKMYRGGYTKENHDSVELIGLYWHFVDLVWIMLFTVVYLI